MSRGRCRGLLQRPGLLLGVALIIAVVAVAVGPNRSAPALRVSGRRRQARARPRVWPPERPRTDARRRDSRSRSGRGAQDAGEETGSRRRHAPSRPARQRQPRPPERSSATAGGSTPSAGGAKGEPTDRLARVAATRPQQPEPAVPPAVAATCGPPPESRTPPQRADPRERIAPAQHGSSVGAAAGQPDPSTGSNPPARQRHSHGGGYTHAR